MIVYKIYKIWKIEMKNTIFLFQKEEAKLLESERDGEDSSTTAFWIILSK